MLLGFRVLRDAWPVVCQHVCVVLLLQQQQVSST